MQPIVSPNFDLAVAMGSHLDQKFTLFHVLCNFNPVLRHSAPYFVIIIPC